MEQPAAMSSSCLRYAAQSCLIVWHLNAHPGFCFACNACWLLTCYNALIALIRTVHVMTAGAWSLLFSGHMHTPRSCAYKTPMLILRDLASVAGSMLSLLAT